MLGYTVQYFNKEGRKHRSDGPAKIVYDKNDDIIERVYHKDGILHRTDGPAVIETGILDSDDVTYYYWLGQRHRYDGPYNSTPSGHQTFWTLYDIAYFRISSRIKKPPINWLAVVWTHFHNMNDIGVDGKMTRETCLAALIKKGYYTEEEVHPIYEVWDTLDSMFASREYVEALIVDTAYINTKRDLGVSDTL